MSNALHFEAVRLPSNAQELRREVRAFIEEEIAGGTFSPGHRHHPWSAHQAFGRRVAERGWIGIAWPKKYGGQERSYFDRYVINEEMLVANAPTLQYFTADRQSGPTLIRYASERIKAEILPRIIRGEACFCIGMSEPDSGSDLFAAKAKATAVDGGWLLNGTKVWTSFAHWADYMIGLFRTEPPSIENRRHGLTSLLVDMRSTGIECNMIGQMSGAREFNEVVFRDVFVPADHLIGAVNDASKQAATELAFERSGPERFLETYSLLPALIDIAGASPHSGLSQGIGRLVAELYALRGMSLSVAGMLESGRQPEAEAAIVKDLGTIWEQELPQRIRDMTFALNEDDDRYAAFEAALSNAQKIAPKLTIQGGTTEILRGIIARGLGAR